MTTIGGRHRAIVPQPTRMFHSLDRVSVFNDENSLNNILYNGTGLKLAGTERTVDVDSNIMIQEYTEFEDESATNTNSETDQANDSRGDGLQMHRMPQMR